MNTGANQVRLHETAKSLLLHYEEVSSKANSWRSIIPQAIREYYCLRILNTVKEHKEDWQKHLCGEDLTFFYENAEGDLIKKMEQLIDRS